jgi:group I intron endonuclease
MKRSDIPSTPGIYAIVNLVNQHMYVGSAVNLLRRMNEHFKDLEASKHNNPHLQSAYDLYGPSAFQFDILEHVQNVEDLLAREQHYIDTLNPEYNIARMAGSTLGITYTDEAKAKLSAARRAYEGLSDDLARATEAARITNTGRKLSPEHLAKLHGRKHTDEAKAKMSAALRGREKSPEVRANMSATRLGKKQSPEHIEKARLAKIGKKQSPEHIAKRAAAQRGKKQSPEHAAKSRVAFLGRKHTDEARAKMSAAGRGRKKSPKHIAKIKTAKAAKRAAKLAQQQVNQPPLF